MKEIKATFLEYLKVVNKQCMCVCVLFNIYKLFKAWYNI